MEKTTRQNTTETIRTLNVLLTYRGEDGVLFDEYHTTSVVVDVDEYHYTGDGYYTPPEYDVKATISGDEVEVAKRVWLEAMADGEVEDAPDKVLMALIQAINKWAEDYGCFGG